MWYLLTCSSTIKCLVLAVTYLVVGSTTSIPISSASESLLVVLLFIQSGRCGRSLYDDYPPGANTTLLERERSAPDLGRYTVTRGEQQRLSSASPRGQSQHFRVVLSHCLGLNLTPVRSQIELNLCKWSWVFQTRHDGPSTLRAMPQNAHTNSFNWKYGPSSY